MQASLGETPGTRWSRRCASLSALAVAAMLVLAVAPLVVPAVAVIDIVRGHRLAWTRAAVFLCAFVIAECAGVAGAAALWCWRIASRAPESRWVHANLGLQRTWTRVLFGTAQRVFGFRVDAEGDDVARSGPFVLCVRHASTADTLLPAVFVANRTGLALRYVLKRELLWDPCLDIVGQRIPNVFVDRSGTDTEAATVAVRQLATGLDGSSALVLYPEGTRFSEARRSIVIAKLRDRGDPRLGLADRLQHTLPPRTTGLRSALTGAPNADVVFLAHRGFDGAVSLRDFFGGSFIGATIGVRLWRVPRAQVPSDPEALATWLGEQWLRLDQWVGSASRDPVTASE